ncbi:MAG: CvpA family protein [Acidobacteriaceae bacterium]
MTPVDWIIVAILAISIVTAFVHGFFVEVFSLAGLIAGVLIAAMYYTGVAAFLGRFIASPTIAGATAFVLVAVAVMIAASLIGRMLRSLFHRVGLGWMDRLAGGAFGAIKGYLLVMLAVTAMLAFFPRQPWLERSQLAPYFVSGARGSANFLPTDLGERVRRGFRIFRGMQPNGAETI